MALQIKYTNTHQENKSDIQKFQTRLHSPDRSNNFKPITSNPYRTTPEEKEILDIITNDSVRFVKNIIEQKDHSDSYRSITSLRSQIKDILDNKLHNGYSQSSTMEL